VTPIIFAETQAPQISVAQTNAFAAMPIQEAVPEKKQPVTLAGIRRQSAAPKDEFV